MDTGPEFLDPLFAMMGEELKQRWLAEAPVVRAALAHVTWTYTTLLVDGAAIDAKFGFPLTRPCAPRLL